MICQATQTKESSFLVALDFSILYDIAVMFYMWEYEFRCMYLTGGIFLCWMYEYCLKLGLGFIRKRG